MKKGRGARGASLMQGRGEVRNKWRDGGNGVIIKRMVGRKKDGRNDGLEWKQDGRKNDRAGRTTA